jgi:hypothetical protein
MAMHPAGSTPSSPPSEQGVAASRPIARYVPTRNGIGMGVSSAPIPGEQRAAPPAAREEPAAEAEETPAEEQQPDAETSRRLGLVARKDKEATRRMDAAAAAEKRLADMEARLTAREKALEAEESKRSEWRKNPRRLLEDNGFVPEAALQFMFNKEKLTPDQQLAVTLDERLEQQQRAMDDKIAALREEEKQARDALDAENRKKEQERLSEEEQIAVQEIQNDIGEIVAGDPKSFPLIARTGERGINEVYDQLEVLSNKEFEASGRRPQITTRLLEKAAKEVEDRWRAEAKQMFDDPELRAALGAPAARPPPRTLSNSLRPAPKAATPPAGETAAEKHMRVRAELDRILGIGRAR